MRMREGRRERSGDWGEGEEIFKRGWERGWMEERKWEFILEETVWIDWLN